MRSLLGAALAACLLLAGCASDMDAEMPESEVPAGGIEDEANGEVGTQEPFVSPTPAPPSSPSATSTPPAATPPAATPPAATPPAATPPTPPPRPSSFAPVTDGPAGDVDRDGIPDALETSLASSCTIAGRTCASLSVSPPTIGQRDLVLVQQGRSGTERNWRANASVWEEVLDELATHGIRAQVADVGLRDDINVSAAWDDPANEGRFWVVWVVYEDPARGKAEDSSGSQLYDLVTVMERDTDLEMRATILHETYHALLGELRTGRSACADEEFGGPNHSSDPSSVLYTSPDCETNDGSVHKLDAAEATELREEPFDVFRTMNEPGWTGSGAVEG